MFKYLILLTITLFIILYMYSNNYTIENWQNYIIPPYNYVGNGSSPLNYYNYPRYRMPYRYPFKFYKSYPQIHYSYGL